MSAQVFGELSTVSSLPGLPRQSIFFEKASCEDGWMPGSSPGMTIVVAAPPCSQTHVHDPAARCARVVHLSSAPKEGVGNAGCPLHPRPRVHLVLVERTRVTTSTPESPGIPARNGFTAYVVLSPVTGLFCHRRPRIGFV